MTALILLEMICKMDHQACRAAMLLSCRAENVKETQFEHFLREIRRHEVLFLYGFL